MSLEETGVLKNQLLISDKQYKECENFNDDLTPYFNIKIYDNSFFCIPKDVTIKIHNLSITNEDKFRKIIDTITNLTNHNFPSNKIEKKEGDILKSYNKIKLDNYKISQKETGVLKNHCVSLEETGVLKKGNVLSSNTNGIEFLNYFFFDCILRVKRKENIFMIWDDYEKRKKLIYDTFKNKDIKVFTPHCVVSKYSYRSSRAYNFPPNIAHYIYEKYGGDRVLDFCAGFGGRLLGFWKSKVKEYTGIDPNKNIPYEKFINWVRENDNYRKKIINIIRKPAEDVNYINLGKFDLIFTSPPYFNLEIYSDDENQSSSRYKTYNSWINNFLFTVLEKSIETLNKGGYLAINIKNIKTPKKYNIADDMNEYLKSKNELEWIENIAFSIPNKSNHKSEEYIYLYKKL